MKHVRQKTHIFAKELLQFSLITYVVLILAETYKEGFVSYYFNMYILLGIIIFLGALVIFTYSKKESILSRKNSLLSTLIVTITMTIVGSILIYDHTAALEQISFVIASVGGLLILFFSLLIFSDHSHS